MPKKRDEGHEETEQVLKELEARITKEYKQAEKELQAKLDDYMRRFKIKDDIKRNAVADGNLDQKEYQQWLIGQIAMGKRWEEMRDTIAEDLTHAAQIAKALAVNEMPDVYAINHNYGTFQVEKASLVDTSYTLYDRDAAARMFKDTDFYKKPGRKVQKAINEGKQKAWDKKQIQSVMFQGIAQGESIGAIATRICKSTCDSDRKAAIRNARTMTTGIQNAGRVDSYKRAEDMGINLKQQWIATLDGRTRHEHRQLDGMMVDVGGVFTVDGYDIEYPGDPSAAPEMVYNCRCTLIPALEGFDRDMSLRHDDHLEDMSYDEWKESHDSYSDPITKQDDIAESMKQSYNSEYIDLSEREGNSDNQQDISSPSTGYGNAEGVISDDLRDMCDDYMARMNESDSEMYRDIFARAEFVESNQGTAYDPDANNIKIDSADASDFTLFHESTHWLDWNQDYKIEEDWGHFKYNYDDDGNYISKEWVSNMHVIKEHASFSEYVAWKWDATDPVLYESPADTDLKNLTRIIGTCGKYDTRTPDETKHDLDAFRKYFEDRGISQADHDFAHLSDFISAMTYDGNLGFATTGGHEVEYWMQGDKYRVAEITAGYNVLKTIGREDMIVIEKELAPKLMDMIEKEWTKVWQTR